MIGKIGKQSIDILWNESNITYSARDCPNNLHTQDQFELRGCKHIKEITLLLLHVESAKLEDIFHWPHNRHRLANSSQGQ